jgi:hypothetical protein
VSKLHPIKHDLPGILWCGPAALSITTGAPTSVIHRIISRITGKRRVKGVRNSTLEIAARELGYALIPIFEPAQVTTQSICHPGKLVHWPGRRPTLAKFLRDHRKAVSADLIIVNVTRHYVVVHGRTFVDNQVKVPMPAKRAPGRRRRVFKAWKVVPFRTTNLLTCPV